MASNPPGAPDEPWDRLRIEEELRKLRDHAEAVQRYANGAAKRPPGKTWTESFAPWVVPMLLTLTIAAIGWAIHQHDISGELAQQYAEQNKAQDLKLTGVEVRLLAMEQTIQAQRTEQEKIATLAATVQILTAESMRARDRLERLEQRRQP